jgi:S-disulfanyl-L-cysteine oxidoreductase SoxD
MSKFPKLALGLVLTTALAAPAFAEKMGLGRPALPAEIDAWNHDVRPDGQGLPEGSGDVATGETLFSDNCAACHGEFAEGVDNWPKLAGGAGSLADQDPLKTVGSYWPYLSTTFDYVHRSMPYGNAQTLAPNDVYAILAYILYSNDLVDENFTLSKENFLDVKMPNADGFFVDNREEVEVPQFSKPACMENCKDKVEITAYASVLDVTPAEAKTEAPAAEPAAATEPVAEPAAPEAPAPATAPAPAAEMAAVDPEQIKAGEMVFKKCAACHKVGEGAKNGVGPMLNGIVGRTAGTVEGYKYSPAMIDAGGKGTVWDATNLDGYLTNPKTAIPKNKMPFAGLPKAEDRAAVIAYLESFAQ